MKKIIVLMIVESVVLCTLVFRREIAQWVAPDPGACSAPYVRTWGLAISPSDQYTATGSGNGVVVLRSKAGERRILDCRAGEVWSLAFTPDSTKLLIGTNNLIAMVSVPDLRYLWRHDHKALWSNVTISGDGRLAASIIDSDYPSISKEVTLYQVDTGKVLEQLLCDDGHLEGVAFLSDGRRIMVSTRDNIHLWDVTSRSLVSKYPIKGGACFTVSPDETLVAVGDNDKTISYVDLRSGEVLQRLHVLGSCGGYSSYPIAFSPDGGLFATGWGGIYLWDARTGMPLGRLCNELPLNIKFTEDGKTLLSTQDAGEVKTWDVSNFKPVPVDSKAVDLDMSNIRLQKYLDRDSARGLVAIDTELADRTKDVRALFDLGKDGNALSDSVTLVGMSPVERIKQLVSITEMEALSFVRQGNHFLIRVRYTLQDAHEEEGCFVVAKLPGLEPGTYRAAIIFDEYQNGQYRRQAAETVAVEFKVK
jgi:hypothetical protein